MEHCETWTIGEEVISSSFDWGHSSCDASTCFRRILNISLIKITNEEVLEKRKEKSSL